MIFMKDPADKIPVLLDILYTNSWLDEKAVDDPQGRTNREVETEVSRNELLPCAGLIQSTELRASIRVYPSSNSGWSPFPTMCGTNAFRLSGKIASNIQIDSQSHSSFRRPRRFSGTREHSLSQESNGRG